MMNSKLLEIIEMIISFLLAFILNIIISVLTLGLLSGATYGATQYAYQKCIINNKGYFLRSYFNQLKNYIKNYKLLIFIWYVIAIILVSVLVIIIGSDAITNAEVTWQEAGYTYVNYSWIVVSMMFIIFTAYVFPAASFRKMPLREVIRNAVLISYKHFSASISIILLVIRGVYVALNTVILYMILYILFAQIAICHILETLVFSQYRN